jgi:hypothetical protein
MTSTVLSTSACHPHSDGPKPPNDHVPVDASARQLRPEPSLHRGFVASISGGLDGAVRVAMMLRGRNYQVRDLTFDIHEGAVLSEIRATILLTAEESDLLIKRLHRMPTVVSVEPCGFSGPRMGQIE